LKLIIFPSPDILAECNALAHELKMIRHTFANIAFNPGFD